MGVGLVRSLTPPDILWIHWRVYTFIANTSKQVLFLPPSDAYVRSFLYLLYTLIKLYYTQALSNQASSLVPDWILLLWEPRIPVSSCDSTTTFQFFTTVPPGKAHLGPTEPKHDWARSCYLPKLSPQKGALLFHRSCKTAMKMERDTAVMSQ